MLSNVVLHDPICYSDNENGRNGTFDVQPTIEIVKPRIDGQVARCQLRRRQICQYRIQTEAKAMQTCKRLPQWRKFILDALTPISRF